MAKQSIPQKLKFEIIYIEVNDDVSSVIERLTRSRNDHLILVVPERAKLTSSILNLQLLAEEAKNQGKKIYLDTKEEEVKAMAEEVNLPVLEVKTKTPLSRGPSFLRDIVPPSKKEKIEKEEVKNRDRKSSFVTSLKEKKEEKKKKRKIFWLVYLIGNLAILVIFFLGFLYFFSQAEIKLFSKKTSWENQAGVLIVNNLAEIDYQKFRLPGEFFKFSREAQGNFSTTEVKDIQTKARGVVKIYNAYSSSPQVLVANTRLLSSEGKLFRLTKQITVPGARVEEGKIIPSFIEAEVIADQPGEAFNIPPSKFSIPGFEGTPKYEKFYGISEKSMSGGYSGKVKVVSQKDLDQAREILMDGLKMQLLEELNAKIPSEFKILEEAKIFSLEKLEFSKKVDEPAENFEAKVKLSLKVVGFREEDLKDLFLYHASQEIGNFENQEVYSFRINYGSPRIDFEKGLFSMPVAVSLNFRPKIDIENLTQRLQGSEKAVGEEILKNKEGIERIEVRYWPKFFPYFPFRRENIKIFLD